MKAEMEMAKDLDPIRNYPLDRVAYGGDKRLPFQLLSDIPRIIEKAMKALNIGKSDAEENGGPAGTDKTNSKGKEA